MMNKFKSKYNYDERERNKPNKYLDHNNKTNYSAENCDLSQKIKNLEKEGLKLRNQVESILQETNEEYSSRTGESMNDCDSLNTNSDHNGVFDSHFSRENLNRSNHKSFDTKQNKDHNSRDNIAGLQKELEECRENLEFMHQKLKQESYAHQMEKEEILLSMENLKRSNLKLKSGYEQQIQDIKFRDKKQESVIECLRSNLNQLLNVNKRQEELLVESGKRLAEVDNTQASLKALDNLRDLLIEIEYHNGFEFFKDYDLQSCPPHVMVDVVDKYFKELINDLDDRSRKIRQLEDDMVLLKRNLLHDKEKTTMELKNQLAYLEEQNEYLKQHINEANESSEREINKLKDEALILKSKLDNEMASATSVIDGLENNLQQLSSKLKRENENWLLEKKSMEKLIDENEKQMAVIRVERDQALNQKSSLLAKLDATQNKLTETETQLLQLESDKYSLEKQIETLNKRNKAIESSLSYTRVYLENITKSIRLSSFRGDGLDSINEGNVNNMLIDGDSEEENVPWRPRKFEMEEMLHEIKVMNKKKTEAEEKFEQMKKEICIIEKQLDNHKIESKKLEQNVKAQQLEIESLKNENSHINSLIANRNGEIERLTAERDYYFQMLNEKTEDLANVKTEKHRLIVMLEERCRQLELQSSNGTNSNQNNESGNTKIIDTTNGKNQVLREERNRLAIQLNELQRTREELITNQKDQTICIEHIRNENMHLHMELKNLYRDYDELVAENKRLLMKLRETDSEVANLCQELQQSKGSKSRKHLNLEKKLCDLNTELSSYKNELKIAQDRIKSMEKLGSKYHTNIQSPIVLNEISKPLSNDTSLQFTKSRLNSLEQQMNLMQSHHHHIKEENSKLTDLLRKVTLQNDRMAEELESYIEENKHLRGKISEKIVDESNKTAKPKKTPPRHKYSSLSSEKRQLNNQSKGKLEKNDSLFKLREDLQESIKEAKKLLSVKPVQSTNEYNNKLPNNTSDSSGSTSWKPDTQNVKRHRSLSEQDQKVSAQNNSNNNCNSGSDNADSSSLNTKRSESASLTEVDRHLNLPRIRQTDEKNQAEEDYDSSVEKLLSSDFKLKPTDVIIKRSCRDSFELEERIKRLLSAEN